MYRGVQPQNHSQHPPELHLQATSSPESRMEPLGFTEPKDPAWKPLIKALLQTETNPGSPYSWKLTQSYLITHHCAGATQQKVGCGCGIWSGMERLTGADSALEGVGADSR